MVMGGWEDPEEKAREEEDEEGNGRMRSNN